MKNTHLMYGGITALAMIIVGLILHIADLSFESWAQYVTYAIFFCGIILNAHAFSKANDHYVTFGSVFSSGFKASAIITLIMIAWAFISIMIFPEVIEKGMEMARERMVEKGLSEEQIDKAMEISQKYGKPIMVAGTLFWFMIAGAFFSLVSAAIVKKKGSATPQAL